MAAEADAFVALPGGFGTLEEILEMITWQQVSGIITCKFVAHEATLLTRNNLETTWVFDGEPYILRFAVGFPPKAGRFPQYSR